VRYLAVDLGDKRTGLAVGDDVTGLVSPAGVIETPVSQTDGLVEAVAAACDEYGAGALVVGLPINMDGTEGPRAKLARELGARLGERAGVPVRFQDERLTSAEADWSMARSGLTRGQKKSRRDALAAAAILRDFLERGPGLEGAPEED